MQEFTSAKVRETFSGTFECRACGFEAPATVMARGRGSAPEHGIAAQEAALEMAEADANAVAARRLTFHPCPKCGKVDPSAKSYVIQVFLGSLALGGLVAVLAYLFAHRVVVDRKDVLVAKAVATSFGALATILLFAWWARPWIGVRKRVHIDVAAGTIVSRDDY